MKYTFVVAFALALVGHADALSAPDKRQTTQEVNDFLASGKATNGMVMIPNLPREEKRQLADMTSEGWAQAVAMHKSGLGSPANLPEENTAQRKRQITAENLAQFEQNLGVHNAGLTGPAILPRQLGDMTPEELQEAVAIHKATVGSPVTLPAEVTQEKRQDPFSPEMEEAWKLHGAANGHYLSGSIKEKRQAYGTQAWSDQQLANIRNGGLPILPRDESSQDKRVPPPDILEEVRAGNNEYYGQPVANVERRVPPPEMLEEMNAPELAPSARVAKSFRA